MGQGYSTKIENDIECLRDNYVKRQAVIEYLEKKLFKLRNESLTENQNQITEIHLELRELEWKQTKNLDKQLKLLREQLTRKYT
jgi:hypothetical protein